MKKIAIIGGGFSGTMTAFYLIKNSTKPIELIIIDEAETFNKGIAFNPYSRKHLLNVPACKMGAFPSHHEHFLDWIMKLDQYKNKDRCIIAGSFLPRYLYGEYLTQLWAQAYASAKEKNIIVSLTDSQVNNLSFSDTGFFLSLNDGTNIPADTCVIANGNHVPRNPRIINKEFYTSTNYFQNPWKKESVINTDSTLPVLIIGNGLTMVDTVLGLLENGFENKIYSISPNGFNILPSRNYGFSYTKLTNELTDNITLHEIIHLFNRHMKLIKEFGLSAEPIIDSLRPYTQKIWQRLTAEEKKLFMSRLRHLWGVARHRIPLHIHDKIQQLRIENKLCIYAGQLIDMVETNSGITVEFYDKNQKQNEKIIVSRVINCTGPETDIMRMDDSFLKACLLNGMISQDELKLGINADTETYQVIDKEGRKHKNLFTLGSNLKGMLWESTAVSELRDQAYNLANTILAMHHEPVSATVSE